MIRDSTKDNKNLSAECIAKLRNQGSDMSSNSNCSSSPSYSTIHTDNSIGAIQNFSSGSLSPAYSPSPPYKPTDEVPYYPPVTITEESWADDKYRKYLELEKEAMQYKDLPYGSFFVIDYGLDPKTHLLLCSN
jgi:hypothetical protein